MPMSQLKEHDISQLANFDREHSPISHRSSNFCSGTMPRESQHLDLNGPDPCRLRHPIKSEKAISDEHKKSSIAAMSMFQPTARVVPSPPGEAMSFPVRRSVLAFASRQASDSASADSSSGKQEGMVSHFPADTRLRNEENTYIPNEARPFEIRPYAPVANVGYSTNVFEASPNISASYDATAYSGSIHVTACTNGKSPSNYSDLGGTSSDDSDSERSNRVRPYRRRHPVTKGTTEYKETRFRNNIAVRRSREKSKRRQAKVLDKIAQLERENQQLRLTLTECETKISLINAALYHAMFRT